MAKSNPRGIQERNFSPCEVLVLMFLLFKKKKMSFPCLKGFSVPRQLSAVILMVRVHGEFHVGPGNYVS